MENSGQGRFCQFFRVPSVATKALLNLIEGNTPEIDIDECSASIPVCNVNANCRNTPGSYICSCKAGFTKDGKTCAGENVVKMIK